MKRGGDRCKRRQPNALARTPKWFNAYYFNDLVRNVRTLGARVHFLHFNPPNEALIYGTMGASYFTPLFY